MTFTLEELRDFIEGSEPEYPDYDDPERDAKLAVYYAWEESQDESFADQFYYDPSLKYAYSDDAKNRRVKFVERFGEPVKVAEWNGGDGHEMGVVFQIGDRFFKKTGYYSSWDSSEFDQPLVEVRPYEVVKIRYREI